MDILYPWVFTGMLFGAMVPYAFDAPAHVVEYTTTTPTVFYAAPALEVKYLAPASLAYAAPVAAETVGFGSFPVEPDDLDAKIKFLVAETLSGVGGLVSTHTDTVLSMSWEGRTM